MSMAPSIPALNDLGIAPATGLTTVPARERLFHAARHAWYSMRRCWWKTLWRLQACGVANVPTDCGVLLCANHASHLDAAAILAALPRDLALRTRTAAAKDVFGDYRARELFSRLTTGAIPLQRSADFARGLRTLEAVLRDGRPLILFPEGRRSADGELVEFKPGAAMLALRTGAPIVPIRLSGVRESLPRGAYIPTATDVRVRFGKPISPAPYRRAMEAGEMDRKEAYRRMTEELRAAIAAMAEAE
jgi:1-acyl-sn-glycerol-3-phosphate acyltransferase